MKKVIVFGNQKISIECTKWLVGLKNVKVVAFIGCEKPQDKTYGYPSTRDFCKSYDIPYFEPQKLDDKFLDTLKLMDPDLCFSIYYRNILKSNYLSMPREGFINIHPSLLPKYRGPMPTLWALLNLEKKVGITVHDIDSGIDTGDILFQRAYLLPKNVTGYQLHNKMMDMGIHLFKAKLELILSGKVRRIKQNHSLATYYGLYFDHLRIVNWFESREKILAKIRAFAKPYAGAVTNSGNKKMSIWNATAVKMSKKLLVGPGRVTSILKDGSLIVSTVNGFIKITEFSFPEASSISVGVGEKFSIYET